MPHPHALPPFKLRLDAEDKAARAPLVPFDGDRASKGAKAQIADFGFLRRRISQRFRNKQLPGKNVGGGGDLAGTSFTLLPIIPQLQLQHPPAEVRGVHADLRRTATWRRILS